MIGECRRCDRPFTLRGYRRSSGHRARGLCDSCWGWADRNSRLCDYERLSRSRDELLEDYVLLRGQGHDWGQCADPLGMTYDSFYRAMARARAAGDSRAGRIGETWSPDHQVRAS